MKKLTLLIILSILLVNCQNKKTPSKKEEEINNTYLLYSKEYNDNKTKQELSDKILKKGDTIAYAKLSAIYALSGHRSDFFYYSFIMANKYDYGIAHYDIYSFLQRYSCENDNERNNFSLESLDKINKEFAIYHLKEANKKGSVQAKEIIDFYKKQGKYIDE